MHVLNLQIKFWLTSVVLAIYFHSPSETKPSVN